MNLYTRSVVVAALIAVMFTLGSIRGESRGLLDGYNRCHASMLATKSQLEAWYARGVVDTETKHGLR